MYKLLLVEDDIDYGTVIQQYLSICRFEIEWLSTPERVIELITNNSFDLAIFRYYVASKRWLYTL